MRITTTLVSDTSALRNSGSRHAVELTGVISIGCRRTAACQRCMLLLQHLTAVYASVWYACVHRSAVQYYGDWKRLLTW